MLAGIVRVEILKLTLAGRYKKYRVERKILLPVDYVLYE